MTARKLRGGIPAMHSPQSAWFNQEETQGLPDFVRVYDANYKPIVEATLKAMRTEPDFGPLFAAMTAEQLVAETNQARERLRTGLAGDWSPYLENLKLQGAAYAQQGIPLLTWGRSLKVVTRELVSLILKTYQPEPERQRKALLAMQAFFDWAMAMLSDVYLQTSQAALRKSEARFRTLTDAGFLGVVHSNLEGRILEANDAYLSLVGHTRADLLAGKVSARALTPPEWAPVDAAAIEDLRTTGVTAPHEKEYLLANGERVPVLVGAAMLDEDTCIAFVLNLTQQKQLERFRARSLRLEVENRRVHEANRLKSEFLANMSHELRTPLNAIIGFAELIHSQQVTPDMPQFEEFVGDILASGRHLLQLINDVLDLSKVEAGRLEFHLEFVDLRKLVCEVVAILRTTAAQKELTVTTDIDPTLCRLFIDAGRLKQVLYNYVSNALKFTDPGGSVIIRARPEEPGFFRLEVVDTGIGISLTDLPRLFSEFQQLDAGASKLQAGTGLGLALTKRLTEAQGGSVGVSSVLGKGSTFFALLPRTAVAGEVVPAPKRLPGAPGAPHILVVEDDPRDQAIVVRALTNLGYAVDTASTARQALERCTDQQYDAVTLDMLLPDASGLEVLQAIRASPLNADVPVIVITVVLKKGNDAGAAILEALRSFLPASVRP
jgi:PAS domain S-box-containing protein